MGHASGLGFEEAPMFDLIMWGKISPSFVAVAAAGVCAMWGYGPVWFGCGFLKAAVKNLLWKNNCGKSDVIKM